MRKGLLSICCVILVLSINDIEEYNFKEFDTKTHIESDKENFLMYRRTFIPLLYHL